MLVVRAWLEEGPDAGELRARIIRTGSDCDAVETVVASEEAVLAAVGSWLRSFTESSSVTAG